jgi:hypothetical protein
MEQYSYTDKAPWELPTNNIEQDIDSIDIHVLTDSQKTGLALLFIFAFIMMIFIYFNWRKNIYSPFGLDDSRIIIQEDDKQVLDNADTDNDGLSDYEELNVYGTSPYLPDTDSDGLLDKDELDNGTDPLCVEGEVCGVGDSIPIGSTVKSSGLGVSSFSSLDLFSISKGEKAENLQKGDIYLFLQDPDEIRRVLIDTKQVDEQALAQIDDETLMKMAREYYEEEVGELPEGLSVDVDETSTSTEE